MLVVRDRLRCCSQNVSTSDDRFAPWARIKTLLILQLKTTSIHLYLLKVVLLSGPYHTYAVLSKYADRGLEHYPVP